MYYIIIAIVVLVIAEAFKSFNRKKGVLEKQQNEYKKFLLEFDANNFTNIYEYVDILIASAFNLYHASKMKDVSFIDEEKFKEICEDINNTYLSYLLSETVKDKIALYIREDKIGEYISDRLLIIVDLKLRELSSQQIEQQSLESGV